MSPINVHDLLDPIADTLEVTVYEAFALLDDMLEAEDAE